MGLELCFKITGQLENSKLEHRRTVISVYLTDQGQQL